MNCPDISFIIPCFNAENTIVRCLDSIIAQSGVSFEIIVVDDASKDNSAEIIKNYQSTHADTAIKLLVHQQNSGVSQSRNDGIDAAIGTTLTFVDADDAIAKDFGSQLHGLLTKYSADCTVCNISLYDGKHQKPMHAGDFPTIALHPDDYANHLKLTAFLDSSCAKLYRRETITRLGMHFNPNITYGEDTLFANQFAMQASTVVFNGNYSGYIYYVNPTSCSHTIDVSKRLTNLEALLDGLSRCVNSKDSVLLLRKCKEYLWTIKKYGQTDTRDLLVQMLRSPLWSNTIYPVIRKHGKPKHRLIICCLQHNLLPLIRLW